MPGARAAPVAVVHVVAKTHLDLGFTALAAEVAERYVDDFFPRAIEVAAALEQRAGTERLVWTTGSWILHHALGHGTPGQRERVAAAVVDGSLAWHALPVTTHTELMDADLFRSGLGISAELDRRFGRTTVAAKMTDVPGHTRSMVPLLAEAGVSLLHLGVNPAWPVPDVPAVFRWRSPDGAEVVVAYQSGGYGGEVVVPGCDDVLAFLHTGDNLGPPSVDEVVEAHADLARRHPGARVQASTLDAFAVALAASGAVAELPVVTAEIGDPWLFGAGSDPQKVAGYRRLLRARRRLPVSTHDDAAAHDDAVAGRQEIDRTLLLVAEHTWGLDQKAALPDDLHWDRHGLALVRATRAGERFEASWAEQRAYVDRAASQLGDAESIADAADRIVPWPIGSDGLPPPGWEAIEPGALVDGGPWTIGLALDGAVDHLVHAASGLVLADADHELGLLRYQSFDERDYERFYAGLTPGPDDEWWARWDNTKPGIEGGAAVSATWEPELLGAWSRSPGADDRHEVVVWAAFDGDPADRLGAPRDVWTRWTWPAAEAAADAPPSAPPRIEIEVWWVDKPANRLPEAMWCSFAPAVAEPERWQFDKLGQPVSPLDVVRRGGRSLHAVGAGMAYDGPDLSLRIETSDAPLVAPGRPNLLDADPPLPDLAGGLHVLLLDNCWGTNFPMWSEGPARFRFSLSVSGARTPPSPAR